MKVHTALAAAGNQVATLKAKSLRMKLTPWRRVERQNTHIHTHTQPIDQTLQKAHLPQTFLLSWNDSFLLLFKPV